MKLLYVDDDAEDREIFCEALSQIDSSILCVTASDGEEGLAKLALLLNQPDFIFLDLNMPRMNGKEMLVELKKSDRFRNIPVVIYSTSLLKHDVEVLNELGADLCMEKPSDMTLLQNKLRAILKLKKQAVTF
jgi:CheY-like chemotaxis protein